MPTWPDAASFARELQTLSRTLNRDLQAATREMAEKAEKVARAEAASDLGGDTQFSGWSGRDLGDLVIKRGRKEGVNDTSHWLFPTRKSGGPWKVAETGRNQGNATGRGGSAIFSGPSIDRKTGATFRTKTGKVRMTRTRRSGRWNGYTAGKGTASRAAGRFEAEADRIGERRFRTALSKHFTVQ
jgi:hypothetical protein